MIAAPTSAENLERDALLLATTMARMDAGQTDPVLPEVFSETLERVFSYTPLDEVRTLGYARNLLINGGAESAAHRLFEEAELAASCVCMETPAGEPRIAVLFAIPVLFSPGDLPAAGKSLAKADHIHELMRLAEIVSSAAEYGLMPHLVPADSLQKLTYGQLHRLTHDLARQVVEGDGPTLHAQGAIPPLSTLPQGEPLLYFLLGVAVVPEEDAEGLFWVKPDDQASQFAEWAINTQQGLNARGSLPSHKPWADEFSAMLERRLPGTTVLAAGYPEGFHDDIRNGWTLWREHLLLETFNAWTASGILMEGISAGFRPLASPAGLEMGWVLAVKNKEDAQCALPWPLLRGETPAEAFEQLLETIRQLGLEAPDLRAKVAANKGCVLLH